MADCVSCGRPQADSAYACSRCAEPVRDGLLRLARLAPELDVTIARQARTGSGGGGERDPLPVNLGASSDAWAVVNTVTTWIRDTARARGIRGILFPRATGPVCMTTAGVPACGHASCRVIAHSGQPVDALVEGVRWLAGQVEWIRHQPDARQVLDELADACAVAVRIVDRSTPRWYAGPCGSVTSDGLTLCSADLYARAGASVVVCPACKARHEARARQEWLLKAARDTLAHAELVGRALAALGLDVDPARVRTWASRGHIVAHGHDQRGRPLYRVGDVEEVALRMARARAAKVGGSAA